jgi:hypothetical protein
VHERRDPRAPCVDQDLHSSFLSGW